MTDQRARAAQLWCLPQHSHKEMDVDFAESIAQALADERRRVWEEAAVVVLQTVIKLDVDWMRTATKAETIAETLRQASAALSAKSHAGQEG